MQSKGKELCKGVWSPSALARTPNDVLWREKANGVDTMIDYLCSLLFNRVCNCGKLIVVINVWDACIDSC